MVVFDNNYLSFLFHERPGDVHNPDTGDLVDRPRERIQQLVARLAAAKKRILVPAPALTELLTLVADPFPTIQSIHQSTNFDIAPFDEKAAIETALTLHRARQAGDFRSGSEKSREAVKFDHQIVGIAKSRCAATLYSSDKHIRALAVHADLPVVPVWELAPPSSTQGELF